MVVATRHPSNQRLRVVLVRLGPVLVLAIAANSSRFAALGRGHAHRPHGSGRDVPQVKPDLPSNQSYMTAGTPLLRPFSVDGLERGDVGCNVVVVAYAADSTARPPVDKARVSVEVRQW